MAKNNHHSHTLLYVFLGIMIFAAMFVLLKFSIRSDKWSSYVVESQQNVSELKTKNSIEDAKIISTSLFLPQNNPLIKQGQQLQNYIERLSEATKRDFVVVDNEKEILADTNSLNVGETYEHDENNEVKKTIEDGQVRNFVEKSGDHPKGISQTVVQLKDNEGTVVGALILSNSEIFN